MAGGVAVALVGLVAVLAWRAHIHDSVGDPHNYGPLTAQEYAFAVKVAEPDYSKTYNHVSFATATVYPGTVRTSDSNLPGACVSGRIVEVDLTGSFPGSHGGGPVAHLPTGPDSRRVVYKVDAATGEACRVTLVIGGLLIRDPHAANLLPALRTP